MRSQFTCLVCALLAIVTLTVDARKTFAVKEGIANGNMMVHSPRVMAYDCMWCFFKDKNNNFCISGDLNWKVESTSSKRYQRDQVLQVPPFYRHTFTYQTTQSGSWFTEFNLKKLFYNSITYALQEFNAGLRLEIYYWYQSYALCFNVVGFVSPFNFKINTQTKL